MVQSYADKRDSRSIRLLCLAILMLAGVLQGQAQAQGSNSTLVLAFEYSYSPKTVTVPAGSTVTWRNTGKAAHTATLAGAFDTGRIAPGAEATVTFRTPGTYRYVDRFYGGPTGEGMNGTVVVTAAPVVERGVQGPSLPRVGSLDRDLPPLIAAGCLLVLLGFRMRLWR